MSNKSHFVRVESPDKVAHNLAGKIQNKLETGPVLWLVSGGSAIDIAVDCARRLAGQDLSNLAVSLADERYGRPGHKDSNWEQLTRAGFSLPGAELKQWLEGDSQLKTKDLLVKYFEVVLNGPVYKIALLGMGADGHTAGLLPGSPAIDSTETIVSYWWEDFARLTLGFTALGKLDEAVLYAAGEAKREQLGRLAAGNVDIKRQPAQIIKRLPRWTVYNDAIGDNT